MDDLKDYITSYAGSLFEDLRNDGMLDVFGTEVSDAVEMFDRAFYDDFMNHVVNIDYTDNCSRDMFRAEIERLFRNYLKR